MAVLYSAEAGLANLGAEIFQAVVATVPPRLGRPCCCALVRPDDARWCQECGRPSGCLACRLAAGCWLLLAAAGCRPAARVGPWG
jgi:hypothetical protein